MRAISVIIILLLLIVGGAWYLSTSAHEEPTRQIEIDVSSDAQKS